MTVCLEGHVRKTKWHIETSCRSLKISKDDNIIIAHPEHEHKQSKHHETKVNLFLILILILFRRLCSLSLAHYCSLATKKLLCSSHITSLQLLCNFNKAILKLLFIRWLSAKHTWQNLHLTALDFSAVRCSSGLAEPKILS